MLQCRLRRVRILAWISGALAIVAVIPVVTAIGCARAIAPATSTAGGLRGSCFRAPVMPDAGSPHQSASPGGHLQTCAAPAGVHAPCGSLDKELIRTEIRSHEGEARSCYEGGLTRNRSLRGRVSVLFRIASDGQVAASEIQSSTMNDSEVEECLGRSICDWHFPKPQGGGVVIVSYPYNFTTDP